MAWVMWRGMVATLIALLRNGHSRLALFLWEHRAFGSGQYWWHGEGVWVGSYEDCDKILRGAQERKVAFGAVQAPAPDLFAERLLIFLPNNKPGSEWEKVRQVLHEFFLDRGLDAFTTRMSKLPDLLKTEWPNPKLEDLSNLTLVRRVVSKSIFFMMFDEWLKHDEAAILSNWRAYAKFFILPRMVQRFLFNIGINKVKKLREQCVGLVEAYNKKDIFTALNKKLGKYKRKTDVQLCDELMYVIGFAGIGGTCAAIESVGAFLQLKLPDESPGKKYILWGEYDTSDKMVAQFKANPETYIKETCRMDPPVTSATTSLGEETKLTLAGKEFTLPKGLLNQYALSVANRDERLFKDPSVFNPNRPNLDMALTWNGAFGSEDESLYPRICPGAHLSLQLATTIVNHALNLSPPGTLV